jgi:chemotaxis protein CheZ
MMDGTQVAEITFDSFENNLRNQAERLKCLVDSGDLAGALGVISELNETRDKTLFQEVGRLTRTLHESIRNFHIDAQSQTARDEISKIEDASDRLAYVIEMTNKAANRTLDLVEETMPIASTINAEAQQLKTDWARLQRREMKPEEFRELSGRISLFLSRLCDDSERLNGNLSNILLAQDFQDLTGQVINRVAGLVKEVEANLVNLVRMAGKVDRITGTVHQLEQKEAGIEGEGPQIQAGARDDVVHGQDDVDDLLSSLGF